MTKTDATENIIIQLIGSGISEPVKEYTFAPPRRWRFDLAWPESKIAIEIDGGVWTGGRHTYGTGFEADCEKINTAISLGWRVFRVTPNMIKDGRALFQLERFLKESLGV